MVQQDKIMEQGVRGASSLTRVWIVLALSVISLIPALPISLGALSGGAGAGIADATRRASPASRTPGGSDLDWNSRCCHSRGNCVLAVIPSLMCGLGSVLKGRS